MTRPTSKQSVLLLGNYRPTLTLARELSKRGYLVMSGLEGCDRGAEHSRYVARMWDHPSLSHQPKQFMKELAQFVETHDVDVIYPVLEEYVAFFADNSVDKVSSAVVASVSPDTVRKCLDKSFMMNLAINLSIPTAPFAEVRDIDQLVEQSNHLGFPLVVRPASSTNRLGDNKAVILEDIDELSSTFPEWPAQQTSLILQEKVTGRRFNVYFSAHKGKVIRYLHTAIYSTDKLDGTGLAVDGVSILPSSDLQNYTEWFSKALNYTGVGCAQFIVDEATGHTSFLEINPRIVGSHAVAEYAGLELSAFPIHVALGQNTSTARFEGRSGIRYVWTTGALQAVKIAWRTRQIGTRGACFWLARIMRSAVVANVHMVFSVDDPKPALMALANLLPSRSGLLRYLIGQRRSSEAEKPQDELQNNEPVATKAREKDNIGHKLDCF